MLTKLTGKTAQRAKGRIGNLFCPIIASTITGKTRAMPYDFIIRHKIERETVSFATDSIITTKKIDVDSSELGGFQLEQSGNDVYVLQNGIYRFNGKWNQRGLGKLGSNEIEHLKTFEKNGKLYYRFKVLRNTRLRSSILQNCIALIGKIREYEREVNLNADRKRLWLSTIQTINSNNSNDSAPISLNYFNKSII